MLIMLTMLIITIILILILIKHDAAEHLALLHGLRVVRMQSRWGWVGNYVSQDVDVFLHNCCGSLAENCGDCSFPL